MAVGTLAALGHSPGGEVGSDAVEVAGRNHGRAFGPDQF